MPGFPIMTQRHSVFFNFCLSSTDPKAKPLLPPAPCAWETCWTWKQTQGGGLLGMRWLRGHCVTESIGQMTGRVQLVMRISCEGEVEVAGPVSRTRMFAVWVCVRVC